MSTVVGILVTLGSLWAYATQPRRHAAPPAVVPIQDGKTLDFSNGKAVVSDAPADRASMDAAVKRIDTANQSVTFQADPPKGK